jgi:hypothetical protein
MDEDVEVPKPCPACGQQGGLTIGMRLVAKPIGTWSLAGAQLKTSAVRTLGLGCNRCGMMLYGTLDADGNFVTTDRPRKS